MRRDLSLGCIIWRPDFRIVKWDKAASRIFGWNATEAVGRDALALLVPPELRQAVSDDWRSLGSCPGANQRISQNLTKNGSLVECEWFHLSLTKNIAPARGLASLVRDVTARRNLEDQLRHAQKMEAVGELAGGIAHDFNNLLTAIAGNVSLAVMAAGEGRAAARPLRDAEKAAERASELAQRLLNFSRKSANPRRPVDLNNCVREALSLLRPALDSRIAVEIREAPDLFLVEADSGEIEQSVINLCLNARDSMPSGGTLIVRTSNQLLKSEQCGPSASARPGEFAVLSVEDTGTGMDAQTREHIFEPFFSTKEARKGTGLGLAMAYRIVTEHGGWIDVKTAPGEGSTFSIFLPRLGPSGGADAVYGCHFLPTVRG